MRINSNHHCYERLESSTSDKVEKTHRRSWVRRLDEYMNAHESGVERMARIRDQVSARQTGLHRCDQILSNPEQFKSRTVRALIHLSKHLEELAEGCADISGLTERVTRNLISSGDKSDMALVIGSAVGRIVSGQLSMLGFAVHKAVGTGLYSLSTLISVGVVLAASGNLLARRSAREIELAQENSQFDFSVYKAVARPLLAGKKAIISKVSENTSTSQEGLNPLLRRWTKHMTRTDPSAASKRVMNRRANCNYMWNHLHQYGPVTQALMNFAYGTFQGANKLMVSFDKHVGTAIGEKVFKRPVGEILGCRLGLTLAVAVSTAISVPMAPLRVGISTVGAMACGVALLAMGLAKLNVRVCHDWRGDVAYA